MLLPRFNLHVTFSRAGFQELNRQLQPGTPGHPGCQGGLIAWNRPGPQWIQRVQGVSWARCQATCTVHVGADTGTSNGTGSGGQLQWLAMYMHGWQRVSRYKDPWSGGDVKSPAPGQFFPHSQPWKLDGYRYSILRYPSPFPYGRTSKIRVGTYSVSGPEGKPCNKRYGLIPQP